MSCKYCQEIEQILKEIWPDIWGKVCDLRLILFMFYSIVWRQWDQSVYMMRCFYFIFQIYRLSELRTYTWNLSHPESSEEMILSFKGKQCKGKQSLTNSKGSFKQFLFLYLVCCFPYYVVTPTELCYFLLGSASGLMM